MVIFWMLFVGLFIGTGARLFLHGRGFATTIVLGLVGSCGAGLLGHALGWFQGPIGTAGILFSAFGAVLVLVVWAVASRRLSWGAH